MTKTNSTGKQSNKKQPSDCHCDEKKNAKSKTNGNKSDTSDCK